MGTIVFPDARWKFFLTCDTAVRTERRYRQLFDAGKHPNKELIATEIQQRDRVDYLGPTAVNSKADDAIEIDTTHFTIDEQVEKILSYISL
jgi:CMP/dCMP kinase